MTLKPLFSKIRTDGNFKRMLTPLNPGGFGAPQHHGWCSFALATTSCKAGCWGLPPNPWNSWETRSPIKRSSGSQETPWGKFRSGPQAIPVLFLCFHLWCYQREDTAFPWQWAWEGLQGSAPELFFVSRRWKQASTPRMGLTQAGVRPEDDKLKTIIVQLKGDVSHCVTLHFLIAMVQSKRKQVELILYFI